MKSLPSLGPILPDSKPLNFLPGIYNLSESLILSPLKELAVFNRKEKVEILLSYNSLKAL